MRLSCWLPVPETGFSPVTRTILATWPPAAVRRSSSYLAEPHSTSADFDNPDDYQPINRVRFVRLAVTRAAAPPVLTVTITDPGPGVRSRSGQGDAHGVPLFPKTA